MTRTPTFPPGWNEDRVREVLAHYREQTEDEAVAEDEASLGHQSDTTVSVPHELLPAVRELIASHRRNGKKRGAKRPARAKEYTQ